MACSLIKRHPQSKKQQIASIKEPRCGVTYISLAKPVWNTSSLGHFALMASLLGAASVSLPLGKERSLCWGCVPSCRWGVHDLPAPASRLLTLSGFILLVLHPVLALVPRVQEWPYHLLGAVGSPVTSIILCHAEDDRWMGFSSLCLAVMFQFNLHSIFPTFLCSELKEQSPGHLMEGQNAYRYSRCINFLFSLKTDLLSNVRTHLQHY